MAKLEESEPPAESSDIGENYQNRAVILDGTSQSTTAKQNILSYPALCGSVEGDPQCEVFVNASQEEIARLLVQRGIIVQLVDGMVRLQEENGSGHPKLEIQIRDLCVEARGVMAGTQGLPSIGASVKKAVPLVKGGHRGATKGTMRVLHNVTGSLRPGTMTLLLGPPGSGKTILLKTLAGILRTNKRVQVSGDVLYNGRTRDEFVIQQAVAYVDQQDRHIPEMSVEETLEFATACQAGIPGKTDDRKYNIVRETYELLKKLPEGTQVDPVIRTLVPQLWERAKDSKKYPLPSVFMQLLDINHVKDTIVGSATVRGVSGGQRKRVTLGEMLVGRKHVLLLDEISTGLDSSTTFSIIQQISQLAAASQLTVVISLLQPPPEVFTLFDDIMLMSAGRLIYHGPRAQCLPHFESLGFTASPRTDPSIFLVEVANAEGQRALQTSGQAKVVRCLTPAELAQAFFESPVGRQQQAAAFRDIGFSPAAQMALPENRYVLRFPANLLVALRREATLMMRDKSVVRGRLIQIVIMGVFLSTLFLHLDNSLDDSRSYISSLFSSAMMMILGGAPQIARIFSYRDVFYKQRNYCFLSPSTYAAAITLCQIPLSLAESLLFTLIFYFVVGFSTQPAYAFFIFWLLLFMLSASLSSLFKLIACVVPNVAIGNATGGFSILLLVLTSGFVLLRGSFHPWWIWAYWISPISYTIRGLAVNEMSSPRWDAPVTVAGKVERMGDAALATFDLQTPEYWIGVAVAYLAGFWLLCVLLTALALTYLSGDHHVPQFSTEQEEANQAENAKYAAVMHSFQSSIRRHSSAAAAHHHSLEEPATAVRDAPSLGIHPVDGHAQEPPPPPMRQESPPPSSLIDGVADGGAVNSAVNGAANGAVDGSANGSRGVDHTFEPASIVFRDIRYSVPLAKKGSNSNAVALPDAGGKAKESSPHHLELLKGISGHAAPGTMTALMGGSGAGKTTLMDCLACRKTTGVMTGEVLINGIPQEKKSFRRISGYVEQNDVHSPLTTVGEALLFSARLRVPEEVPDADVRALVDSVMGMVDLRGLCNGLVGTLGVSGLSGEQRKRLTMATELVANPSILFMDEPTSGLDSRAARNVIRASLNIRNSMRTVMVTIHQPSMEIFESFDWLLLLKPGGQLLFFGELGDESMHLVRYLEGCPGVAPLPGGYNPATWMLEVTGGARGANIKASDADFVALFEASDVRRASDAIAQQLLASATKSPHGSDHTKPYAASFSVQSKLLLRRWARTYWRSPSYNLLRCLLTLLIALVFGTFYYQLGDIGSEPTQGAFQNAMGALFVSGAFLGNFNQMTVQSIIAVERTVSYRERAAGYYGGLPFVIAMGVVELPYLVVQSLLFGPIFYFMVGYERLFVKFVYYQLMLFVNIAQYTLLGQLLVVLTPSPMAAAALGGMLNFLFNMFNGFSVPYPQIPTGWKWLNRISPSTWMLYGLISNQYGDNFAPMSVFGSMTTLSDFIDDTYGYQYQYRWWCLLGSFGYIVLYRLLAAVSFTKLNYNIR
eukprot:jgi/Mesvir1/22811/Mv14223-RA.1